MSNKQKNWVKIICVFLLCTVLIACQPVIVSERRTTTQMHKLPHLHWPLYKITKDEQVGYLLGTIHVGFARMYPFPTTLTTALATSTILVGEVDKTTLTTTDYATIYSYVISDTSLQERLTPEAYAFLEERAVEYGLDLTQLQYFKTWYLLSQFTLVAASLAGETANFGVDNQLFTLTETYQLKNAGLEQDIDQYEALLATYNDAAIEAYVYSIPRVAVAIADAKTLMAIYRTNNMEKLLATYDETNDALVDARNLKWAPQMIAYLESEDISFFAVGYFHLVGEKGLIQLLKNAGYTVELLDNQ